MQIRSLARAVYEHSTLRKYALNPKAPIRIVVENGKVELHGVVANSLDRQVAYTLASTVPGVYSVKNNLMIASEVTR